MENVDQCRVEAKEGMPTKPADYFAIISKCNSTSSITAGIDRIVAIIGQISHNNISEYSNSSSSRGN